MKAPNVIPGDLVTILDDFLIYPSAVADSFGPGVYSYEGHGQCVDDGCVPGIIISVIEDSEGSGSEGKIFGQDVYLVSANIIGWMFYSNEEREEFIEFSIQARLDT